MQNLNLCLFKKHTHHGQGSLLRAHAQNLAHRQCPTWTKWAKHYQELTSPCTGQECERLLFPGEHKVSYISLSTFHTGWARHWNETGGGGSGPACGNNFHPILTSFHFSEPQFPIQERDFYETWVGYVDCMSTTISCYTPTLLMKANVTVWDLLKTNSQSSFKLERSSQATLIKSRTFGVRECSSQIMKNSFFPYQSWQHNKLLRAYYEPSSLTGIISSDKTSVRFCHSLAGRPWESCFPFSTFLKCI